MAGMPGRSGGHNKITVLEHQRRGTFKPGRHGGRLAGPGDEAAWAPAPADLTGLGAVGRRFVRSWLKQYDVSTAEGALLLEAGWMQQRLAELRTLRATGVPLKDDAMLARLELGTTKALAGLLAQLRIERCD